MVHKRKMNVKKCTEHILAVEEGKLLEVGKRRKRSRRKLIGNNNNK